MMIRALWTLLCLLTLSLPGVAQNVASTGSGAVLRSMDKMSGDVDDFELIPAHTKQLGRLQVTLGECRYPEGNPTGDAFAFLVIRNAGAELPVFEGWMIASSPALSALDHARYDIWVLRCITP